MQKNDIADIMVSKTNLTKSQALEAINAFTDTVSRAICRGENIYIRGFATLKVVHRAPKKARNIKKGTEVLIPARSIVKFIPGKELKSALDVDLLPW